MITGSLQTKNNMYYAVLGLVDETTGKRKQKWISTGLPTKGNKRKAEIALRNFIAEYEQTKLSASSDILFVDWLWIWMEQKKSELRVNSYEAYEIYIKLHIEPYFRPLKLRLRTVTPQHIQNYYNSKHADTTSKKGLSANSIKRHHAVIHGSLGEAVRKNLIPYNPADRVTLPKIEPFVGKAYTKEQANNLLKLPMQEPLRVAVVLGLFYGLRRSEVCGLRWQDVDFDAGTLRVCNTVVKTKTLIEHEKTKSRASKRTMLLVPETVAYFKELKAAQERHQVLCGKDYADSGHVCMWQDGRAVAPDYISRAFRVFLAKNGLPHIRFHELRHTAGSLLLEKGLSAKQIQEYLGHEKVSTTLDIYGHLSVEGKAVAAHTMNSLLEIC